MNSVNLFDSITIIVADDANVLCFVNLEDTNVVTLPTAKVPNSSTWKETINKELNDLFGNNVSQKINMHKITKVFIPGNNNDCHDAYIVNIVIWIKVTMGFKNFFVIPTVCPRFSKLKWLNTRDLNRFFTLHVVESPILFDIFPKLKEELKQEYSFLLPLAINVMGCYCELTNDVFNKCSGNAIIDQMIEESPLKMARKEIYMDFLKLISPNILMSCGNFQRVITKLGFTRKEGITLFRAADLTNRGFLSFNEYFGIFAAMEPNAKHVGMCGKARATYIFRYLNKANDGKLSLKELKELVIMVRRGRQQSIDAASIEKELREVATVLNINPLRVTTLNDFIKVAEDMRFRGVNNVLRSSQSLATAINSPTTDESNGTTKKGASKPLFMPHSIERSLDDQAQWEMATHSMQILRSGAGVMIENIFDSNVCTKFELDAANITQVSRRKSLESLSPKHICNELIDQVRELAQINGIKSGNRGKKFKEFSWGRINFATFAHKLMIVCQLATEIFINEPRMLTLNAPIYILGDFHGNFGDMLYFEQMLWPLSLFYLPSSVLFLGDYVDRGSYSIEVITYLLANKVLHPKKIFTLRGNHEIRDVQQSFTFITECIIKFGEQIGRIVWDAVNTCFDYMPLAAVIDNQLFCCHGGIPPPWLCPNLESINKIPKPLPHPDIKSPLAWELLWNDPIKDDDITREIHIELSSNEGFSRNLKRGTAHVFSQSATTKFLQKFNFSHIIRAHELAMTGFSIFHKGKVISIFSTSIYNNCDNEAACLLVENFNIKVIRLSSNI